MKPGSMDRPRFFWQTILIVLPVVILTSIALLLLRQERASIEQEARLQAAAVRAQISARLGPQLDLELGRFLQACSQVWLEDLGRVGVTTKTAGVDSRPAPISNDNLPWCECLVDGSRRVLPSEYSAEPTPADWPFLLPPPQRTLWAGIEEALFRKRNPQAAEASLRRLLTFSLPDPVSANVHWNLLLLAGNDARSKPTGAQFIDLARRYPDALSPAGLPIADVALHRSIVAARSTPVSDKELALLIPVLARRSAFVPSLLTSRLLEEAAASGQFLGQAGEQLRIVKRLWVARELTSQVLTAAAGSPQSTSLSGGNWFRSGSGLVLVMTSGFREQPGGDARYVAVFPADAWNNALTGSVARAGITIPEFIDLEVNVGGRWTAAARQIATVAAGEKRVADPLSSFGLQLQVRPSEAFWEMLVLAGQATGRFAARPRLQPSEPLPVRLILARPEALFAQYRRRVWMTAGFILAAAGAAFLGLAGTWRAYRQQRRLAEMQSGFVSSVSHELRAPIASVRLLAESLDSGKVVPEGKRSEYYHLIVQECRRLSALIENALDFSRIGRGRKSYEFEPTDLQALIVQTVALMRPAAEQAGVELLLEPPPAYPSALVPCLDGHALEQALVNLVDNAIKHAPGGKRVTVGYSLTRHDAGALVIVSVTDEGEGIPVEDQSRIFEPFYRRESKLRPQDRGVGIGLTIVKHVAQAHGGRVVLVSELAKGSRFTLELVVKALEEPKGQEEEAGETGWDKDS